ncbi:MAG: hypothetical protein KME17_08175 [Cyanosarcina radialis HA8281-LM2]|jgi:hypothetical protein|nr:hypothetical protein [Cyanosarcina radialis HA8281-LM2]
MIPARSQTEDYLSLNQIATHTSIHSYRLQYHAQKQQLRYMKYQGMRWIEINCAIALLEWFREFKNIDTSSEIERLKNLRSARQN